MRTETRTPALLLSALIGLLAIAAPAGSRANTVLECNLSELQGRAGTIFHGRCIERREITEGVAIPQTEYRFRVVRAAKGCRTESGELAATIVFRHAGTRKAQVRADGTKVVPLRLGIPEYEPGREYVLFLTRESKLRLCAPVGLGQGSFAVERRGRQRTVRNSRSNLGLLRGIDTRRATPKRRSLLERARSEGKRLRIETLLSLCGEETK